MNLTGRAKQVLAAAQIEAQSLGHTIVNSDHVALALLRSETPAAMILENQRIDRERVLASVAAALAAKAGTARDVADADRLLANATARSTALGHAWVGTEHILLAFFDHASSAMAQALTSEGLTAERVAAELNWMLGPDPTRPATLGPGPAA